MHQWNWQIDNTVLFAIGKDNYQYIVVYKVLDIDK